MAETTTVRIRMDADLKTRADELFAKLGINLSIAVNIFIRQSLQEGGLPFKVKINQQNPEIFQALADTNQEEQEANEGKIKEKTKNPET